MLKKLAILSFIVVGIMAFGDDNDTFNVKLEESIVTATGFDDIQSNQIKNTTVVTAQDIHNKGYNTVEEILRRTPGVNFVNNAFGYIVDVRGQGVQGAAKNVKVLVDGSPLNILDMSHAILPLNSVPVEDIEKIEIINGGGTVLYGSGTAGGVINIITKKTQEEPVKNKVYYQNSSFETNKFGFGTSIKFTDNFLLDLAYENVNGNGYRRGDKRDGENLRGGFTYNITDNQTLRFRATRYNEESKETGGITKVQLDRDRKAPGSEKTDSNLNRTEYTLNYEIKPTNNLTFSLLGYNQKTIRDYDIATPMRGMISKTDGFFKDTKNGIDLKGKYDYSLGNIIFGYEYIKNKSNRHSYSIMSKTDIDLKKDTHSAFIQGKHSFTDKLDGILGYRYEHADYNIYRNDRTNTIDKKTKKNNSAYEAGLNFKYSDTGNVYAKYERGYRSPSPTEMADKSPIQGYTLNNLKSEKYDTYEIGIKDMLGPSFVSLTGFYTKKNDEILINMRPGGHGVNWTYKNLQETERKGIELFAEQYFGSLRVNESVSYVDAKISKGTDKDKKIPYVSKTKVTLGANYEVAKGLNLMADLNYFSNSVDSDYEKIKGYSTTDLGVSYAHKTGLGLQAGVKNVFDKKYYKFKSGDNYIPESERTYYVGVNYSF